MTLRITIEIVPYGDEAHKRVIHQFEVSNMGSKTPGGQTRYAGKWLNTEPWNPEGFKLLHRRELGALRLARKALQLHEAFDGYEGSQKA